MSERKAVIKNADMSEVRLGRVASCPRFPDRFRRGRRDASGATRD